MYEKNKILNYIIYYANEDNLRHEIYNFSPAPASLYLKSVC